jgi:hydroxyacylglutathione hydrolase
MTEDLSQWRELRRISSSANNCYLVWDEISREGALFDTASDSVGIFAMIEAEDVQLRHVFLTHQQSIEPLRARFPKLLLHTSSKDALPQHRNRPNDFIHLGNLRITNRALMDDKVAYVVGNWPEDAPHVAFVGDLATMPNSLLREKVLTLPGETLVCPGSGELTTVAQLNAVRDPQDR